MALASMLALPGIRSPLTYGLVFSFPLMFLVMYHVIGGAALGVHVLFGSLITFVMNSGIVSLPQIAVEYKQRRLQDIYVASPVHPLVYLLGLGLSRLIHVLPGCVVLFAILLGTGVMHVSALPLALVVLVMCWATGCSIGFMIATYNDNVGQVSAVANLLGMLALLIPPVLYPLDMLKGAWQWIALAAPSASAAHLLRAGSGASRLVDSAHVLTCWGVLGVYVVVSLLLVAYKSRWRER
jgi:ABC-type polysaccharide/polyol phosphate export permease